MRKSLFLLLFLLPFVGYSQKMSSFRNVVPDGYNFWVYTPAGYDSTASEQKPLVLFLHGSSLTGTDLNRVRRYGTLDALEMGRKIDAVVVAPQTPGGGWSPAKIKRVVDWVQAHYPTDTNRFYVLGMSMGGYGTINFVAAYPEMVAAAMALCGGGSSSSYCGLTRVPMWIMHGTADRAVSLSESQKVVNAMVACGDTSLLRFTKLPGKNHSDLARIFYLDETYQWLFAHSRADSVKRVNRSVVINNNTMTSAYQNINRSGTSISFVNGTTGKAEPKATPSASSSSGTSYHVVKKGDTLSAIARKYKTTVAKLCKLNNIKETTVLQIGKKLKIR